MKPSRATDREWLGLFLVILAIIAAIALVRPVFLSPLNLRVLLATVAINLLIALSQAVVIAMGQMNLSVGAIGGLAAITFAGLMEVFGLPPAAAALLAVAVGACCGLANGLIVAMTGVSAFIVTLASLYLFSGFTMGITEAMPFYGIPDSVKAFGNAVLGGIVPLLLVPSLVLALLTGLVFARLRIGRHILAAGENAHAAELAGVSIARATVWVHLISGILAAVAAILVVARIQIGQPTIGGDWLILSFAAPVIGGAVLAGGTFSVVGTLQGVVIIALITQGLVLFGVDPFAVQIALGALILWAVTIGPLQQWWLSRRRTAAA
jgi:ribose transport system permease protein